MPVPPVPNPSAALLDLVAKAEAEPDSAEAYFLAQLRAAIAGLEGIALPPSPPAAGTAESRAGATAA